ncbi:hypothetical protein HP550_01015 [Cellulomonas humilata]|uniref:Uncharacterized protein n=1 Tax=Cellulomonas humilata TaxID=144055 RepID=A0A7Y5ZXJ5_9CELL|nr:hypothetical protein [Cellulomonas humilata]NUU15830.1 hypothetical protein [Cellulomonas humilata]
MDAISPDHAAGPDWDAIDLLAARRVAAGAGTTHAAGLVITAQAAGCALALVRDEATGWLVVVVTNTSSGATFVPTVIDPSEETRMLGSVAPAHGVGPRLHYALAKAKSVGGIRVRVTGGQWTTCNVERSEWAAICLAQDDFFAILHVELLDDDAWDRLV